MSFGRGGGNSTKFGVDIEGVYSTLQLGGSGGMLPQIFFYKIDALRLILRHSGGISGQF